MSNNDIVQKLWNLCDVLRDDGINYSDYVTELVLLLFIKMVHEKTESNTLDKHTLPEGCRWTDLNSKSGITLLNDYKQILLKLSTGKDAEGNVVHADPLISAIYADAQTRLREARHLEQLISNFDQIDWYSAQKDGLGDLYEGLLEKNANETKSGAGQYFTPRPLIDSMVRCLKPQPGELIQDPAAGTGGFLISADKYIKSNTDDHYDLSAKDKMFQKTKAFVGVELVPSTRRLALMNCLLHEMDGGEEGVVLQGNALGMVGASLAKANVIFANPPFGTSKGGEASITRDDLTYRTTNKQLAFLQHIYRNLQPGGRAAVVVPDNVLFEAGVGTEVRRDLMNKCNLHTILRLPTGIFYAQGVKTNVLFFNKGSAKDKFQDENCTEDVWVYDLRTNMPSFGKRNPFNASHLKPFETVYDGSSDRTEGEWSFSADKIAISDSSENQNVEERLKTSRWRMFSRKWIRENKDDSLDITWLQDNNSIDAASLPEPSVLAGEAMSELVQALGELDALMRELGASEEADAQKVLLGGIVGRWAMMTKGKLPYEWKKSCINDIATVVAGGTPKAANPDNFAEPGTEIAWLTPADLSGYTKKYIKYGARDLSECGYNSSSAKLMPKGTLLFSSRAPIGYVAIAANEISTNQGFKNFIFTDHIEPSFAYYYLRNIRGLAESLGTGTTFKEISGATAKKLPFVIVPLPEQKVITQKLDSVLSQVNSIKAHLDKIPQVLKQFRQSVLSAAVNGKLTEEWRKKQGLLLTDWIVSSVGDIAQVATGKTPKRTESKYWDGGNIPWLTSASTGELFTDAAEQYVTSQAVTECLLKVFTPGTLLLAMYGEGKTRGQVTELRISATCNQACAAIIANPKKVNHNYLKLLLMENYEETRKVAAGGAQPNLNLSKVRDISIFLPSLEEQTEIVRRVEKLFSWADSIEKQVIETQQRVNNLTQSILAKAFRGELTEQWRKDNPDLISGENSAESLLKKIKAERELTKPAKLGRKKS